MTYFYVDNITKNAKRFVDLRLPVLKAPYVEYKFTANSGYLAMIDYFIHLIYSLSMNREP